MQKNIITRALTRSLRHPRRFGALARATVPVLLAGTAWGASVTWDPARNHLGSDGAGVWSAVDANWANGVSDAGWASGNTAVFGKGGSAGAVAVSGTVTVGNMIFDLVTGNYAVSGGTIAFGSSATITTNANATIASLLNGSGTVLTKDGTGMLTVNGSSGGISAINVTAGTLATATSGLSSFGNSSTAIVVSNGAKIQVGSGSVIRNQITFNGGSGDAAVVGGATLTGGITLGSFDSIMNVGSAAEISGRITGSGSITKSGSSKLTLSGANDYTGTTTINDGVVEVATGGSLGTGGVINKSVLTFTTEAGAIMTIANAISGAGSITKGGLGTLVLAGASTYTGATTLGGGTLIFNGTLNGNSSTTQFIIGTGTTLGGTGTIVGATSGALTMLAGGAISPGLLGTIGTLTATSLSWTTTGFSSASMFFDLSSTDSSSDLLKLTGSLARTGTSYIFDFGGGGMLGQTYTLISYGSTTSTTTSNLVASNLGTGLQGLFSFSGNSLKLTVVSAVPEPAQAGVAIAAALGLIVLARRRRNKFNPLDSQNMKLKSSSATSALLAVVLAGLSLGSTQAKTVTIKLETATFDELQAAMNAGAITSVELATLYLNRRAAYDQGGIKINSVVAINPNLFDDAAASDELRANGVHLGPLQGLVFCTKDSYPTLDMVTTGGVKSWLSPVTGTFGTEAGVTWGPVTSPADCFVVAKLKAAGAVQLGHGNMDTWATSAGSTTSNAYGTTLNAYVLGSASGSSGGPGAMTGANFSNFAWGGETGGSIRNPSDRAGITGFKVSVGTNSVNHIIPLASDRDVVGPMARYVKDEAYIMDASATVLDPEDLWAPINYVPGRPLASGYAAKAATGSLAGKVIGVVGTYLGTARPVPAPTPVQLSDIDVERALGVEGGHGGIQNFPTTAATNTTGVDTPQASIKAVFDRTVAQLQAQGATVVTVFLPPNMDTSRPLPTTYTDGTLTPTAALGNTDPRPGGSSYANECLAFENAGFQTFHGQGIYTRLTQANAASSSLSTTVRNLAYAGTFADFTVPAAVTHFKLKAIYNAIYEKFMDSNGLNCLIWPTSFTKSRSSNSVSGRDLVNNMGLPVCTVPIGLMPETGEPVTMAMLGRYRKEADVLALAAAYQKAYNYRIPSTIAPPLDGETISYTTTGTLFLQKKADKLAPVVSIKKKAKLSGTKVTINGVATDASGIQSIKVYVNGRKIAVKAGKRWTAKVPLSDIKKWTKSKSKALNVVALVKDTYGNTSATEEIVKL